ncbi:MAG: guanylate kinase [Longimicrobiales bacterium]
MRRRAFPLVLSAPSGAGKTSIARALVERDSRLVFSISATTRPARAEEQEGSDYMFVGHDAFERMIGAGELLEWATVHERRYGTPRAAVESAIARGDVVVLDIDIQGARQVRRAFTEAVLVFVLPPSATELIERLTRRGSEGEEQKRRRLENALLEVAAAEEFDYVVVNDDLETTVAEVEAIVRAERLRCARIEDLEDTLAALDRAIREHLERSA